MSNSNSHVAIDTLAWLIEEAFDGDPSQSLLANLHDLREEDWIATPSGIGRSIADILEHVGWSKWMYEDYAFGSASVRTLSDDSELDKDYLTNWGERLPTRDITRIMIAHDFYHAGEINHLRALLQSTDRWPYD